MWQNYFLKTYFQIAQRSAAFVIENYCAIFTLTSRGGHYFFFALIFFYELIKQQKQTNKNTARLPDMKKFLIPLHSTHL